MGVLPGLSLPIRSHAPSDGKSRCVRLAFQERGCIDRTPRGGSLGVFPQLQCSGDLHPELNEKGLSGPNSMLEPDAQYPQFGVIVFRQDVPSPGDLDDVTVMLFDLAEAAGGRYDGWECAMHRGESRLFALDRLGVRCGPPHSSCGAYQDLMSNPLFTCTKPEIIVI